MAVDITTPNSTFFRSLFPEFQSIPEHTLQTYFAVCGAELNADVWGALYASGVCYLVASRLAATPFGQQAKLADQTGRSSYLTHYERLQTRVAVGVARVT
jgi:hypothetical protein